MNINKVSDFTLERYRLGELSPEEKKAMEQALVTGEELRFRLEKIDESDRELRLLYNAAFFNLDNIKHSVRKRSAFRVRSRVFMMAAAVLMFALLPVLYFTRSTASHDFIAFDGPDRPKGQVPTELEKPELFVYLKGGGNKPLTDYTPLEKGNTVQLAYTTPAGAEHYGVIFSIDGRSVVTMHYPYRRGQNTRLVSGRRTLLNEAYILDDAPDYEVFVFVVSPEPLNADTVLQYARNIAGETKESGAVSGSFRNIKEKSLEVFTGCEVETVTVLKF